MSRLALIDERHEQYELCAYCPKMCRFACPVAEADAREALTPWAKMSAPFLLTTEKKPVSLATAFETSWGCTNCGHCTEYCAHGNQVGPALAAVRAEGVRAKLPSPVTLPSWRGSVRGMTPASLRDEHAATLYLPGCGAVDREPASVRATIKVLERLAEGGVLATPHDDCCGVSLYWAGRHDEFDAHAAKLAKSVAKRKKLVVGDAGCAWALAILYPQRGHVLKPEVVHLSAWIAAFFQERALKARARVPGRFLYHDPCMLARQLDVVDEPRAVLASVLVEPVREFAWNRRDAVCCGGGALLPLSMPATAARMADRRAQEARDAKATVVTSCATCIGQLRGAGVDAVDLMALVGRAL